MNKLTKELKYKIYKLSVSGYSTYEIAKKLNISEYTVVKALGRY